MARISKLWRFLPTQKDLSNKLGEELGISPIVAQVLINRGIDDYKSAQEFLRGGAELLADPWLMAGMQRAVERIKYSLANKEKITIYGDYDVDGITATALLFRVLKKLGAEVEYYIPERQSEGYGLNAVALEALYVSRTALIITVDCGISALTEVANMAGKLDIIITDHHQPPPELPPAFVVINPKLPFCDYPDKQLAGVGVAFKLCQALWQSFALPADELMNFLDLVAVGTIADIVPLTGENRIMVKLGLKELAITNNNGLKALREVAGISGEAVNSVKVGFTLAPRLNAAGRLSHAAAGVELLVTDDDFRAREVAELLNSENSRRQAVEKKLLVDAEEFLAGGDHSHHAALVLAGADWHPGVIGIVASRLVEKYYKPVVMISVRDGIGKGSCRSIPGFDIYRALEKCNDLLLQFGGHHQAAGLSIDAANIDIFRLRLSELATKWLTADDYQPVLNIESQVALTDINTVFLEQLVCLAPHGMGNPSPVFVSEKLAVAGIKPIGQDGRHFKLRVKQRGVAVNVMAWDLNGAQECASVTGNVDVAYVPEFNDWQGQRYIQLRARDIKASGTLPAGVSLSDKRGIGDKPDYVANLAQNNKIIVYTNDRSRALKLAAKLRRRLPGRVAVIHEMIGGDRKDDISLKWRIGKLSVLICSHIGGQPPVQSNHVVWYDPPLSNEVFNLVCQDLCKYQPNISMHFIYSGGDLQLAARQLLKWYPDRTVVGWVYIALKNLAANKGKLEFKLTAVAGQVESLSGLAISEEGVGKALAVLAELDLLDVGRQGGRRVLALKPQPQNKTDIEKSEIFQQGAGIRTGFATWAQKLLQTTVAELWNEAAGPKL